jgi:hypothetical protein
MNQDDPFPEGNAKVGDAAVYAETAPRTVDGVTHAADQWMAYVVTQVGLKNKEGYGLNIKIAKGANELVVSPFSHPRRIFIFPPKKEFEKYETLVGVLEKYPDLRVVRWPCNTDEVRYKILCTNCMSELRNVITSEEVADLRFVACDYRLPAKRDRLFPETGFSEGKPEVSDSHTETVCDCDGVTYEFPEIAQYE